MKSLNFHQTFPPTLAYIGRLLDLAAREAVLTKEEISAETGIPTGKSTGKVEPHIDYSVLMGLIRDMPKNKEGKFQLILTPLGGEIVHEDRGFTETVTQLICHVRLTSPKTGADLWNAIIRDILPQHRNGVSSLVLEDELKKKFGPKVKMGPFFSTYRESFSAFTLIDRTDDGVVVVPLPYQRDLTFVYAYALIYEWEKTFPDRDEISANDLKELRFGCTFGWSPQAEFEVLEHLNEMSIIRMNRQLSPFTLTRQKNSLDMIRALYSLLI
jgi:hypothetical protein